MIHEDNHEQQDGMFLDVKVRLLHQHISQISQEKKKEK
jgi:hypothetical protein